MAYKLKPTKTNQPQEVTVIRYGKGPFTNHKQFNEKCRTNAIKQGLMITFAL